jgi:archaetidylinositol phosphate synthase
MTNHTRINGGLLAAAEKRLLLRIAGRLPAWVHSDQLTLLAIAAMALAGTGFALARWDNRALWLVIVGLGLNWFGDSLDGTLARVRRVERPRYGYYVDHALDLAGTTLLMTGLALSGYMTPVVATAVLVGYLLAAGEVFLATSVRGQFRMSVAGVGPTELRIILAIGTVALFRDPHMSFGALGQVQVFDLGGAIAAAGMAMAFCVAVWRNASALRHEEHDRTARFTKAAADLEAARAG